MNITLRNVPDAKMRPRAGGPTHTEEEREAAVQRIAERRKTLPKIDVSPETIHLLKSEGRV